MNPYQEREMIIEVPIPGKITNDRAFVVIRDKQQHEQCNSPKARSSIPENCELSKPAVCPAPRVTTVVIRQKYGCVGWPELVLVGHTIALVSVNRDAVRFNNFVVLTKFKIILRQSPRQLMNLLNLMRY